MLGNRENSTVCNWKRINRAIDEIDEQINIPSRKKTTEDCPRSSKQKDLHLPQRFDDGISITPSPKQIPIANYHYLQLDERSITEKNPHQKIKIILITQ